MINRFTTGRNINGLKSFEVKEEIQNDAQNIAEGIFSPLEGFLTNEDFENVLNKGRLTNGIPWTIPIVFDVKDTVAKEMKDLGDVILSCNGIKFAILHLDEIYKYEKLKMANSIFKTIDNNHPGVYKVFQMDDILIDGKIEFLVNGNNVENSGIRRFRMTPQETRNKIIKRGWKTVVGFQTRNVPHIAHEMLQKAALNIYDGLFINPLIGKKKLGDFTDTLIVDTYDKLIKSYYVSDNVLFATLHTEMRYGGPREAIHHAIMRKNFGCSHFIVGRDHAGVGTYYPPYAAQKIFSEYPDLGIEPIFFSSFYYCKKCSSYANKKTCPHSLEFREELSGTAIRKMVNSGKKPKEHLMRPEIAEMILKSKDPFVRE